MLKSSISVAQAFRQVQMRAFSSGKDLPIIRAIDAKRKDLNDILETTTPKTPVSVSTDETMDIGGVPSEHQETRVARIFRRARESTQTPWNNTKVWRIELDNRQRWENPLMGWSSSGDPLSNIGMSMKFASKEDAVAFCEKNRWTYEIEMSLALAPTGVRQGAPEGTATIQKLLDENSQLLNRIKELQAMGKADEATPHQQLLHRNLVFLAKAADQSLLTQLVPENTASPSMENGNSMGAPAGPPPPQQQNQMQAPPPPAQQQQMHPQMGMPQQMGMPMPPHQHYPYPPQAMPPHGYPGQPYDPQQQMPPPGPGMGGYMPQR